MFDIPPELLRIDQNFDNSLICGKMFYCVMLNVNNKREAFELMKLMPTSDLFMIKSFLGYPFDRQNPDAYAKTHMLNFVMFDRSGNLITSNALIKNDNNRYCSLNFMLSPWAAGLRLYDADIGMYFHPLMKNATTIIKPGLRLTFDNEKTASDLIWALENHVKTERRFDDEKFGDYLKYKEGMLTILNDYLPKTSLIVCRQRLQVIENSELLPKPTNEVQHG